MMVLAIGRHHVAAGHVGAGVAAGGIHGDEHDDLGIVRRGEAQEGHHHVAGLALIGRTGLAADAVARHLAVFAGAAGHHVFQAFPDGGGGLLADDLPHRGVVVLIDHVAVAVA